MRPNLRRKDGTFWCSSYPRTAEEGHWAASLFDDEANVYFFRHVERGPWYWPFWKETGKVWKGKRYEMGEFEIIRRD